MLSSPLAFNSNRLVQNSIWSKKAKSIKGVLPTSEKCNLLLATNNIIHLSLIIMFHELYDISSTSFYGMWNRPSEFSMLLTLDFRYTHTHQLSFSYFYERIFY